jgi:hypothetical protein
MDGSDLFRPYISTNKWINLEMTSKDNSYLSAQTRAHSDDGTLGSLALGSLREQNAALCFLRTFHDTSQHLNGASFRNCQK